MGSTVQARLDDAAQKTLARLMAQLGWSPSRVVREGLRALAAIHPPKGARRIVGIGKFSSGIPDLATNKDYLKDFGR